MIDVHVLTWSGVREDWLKQCLSSLEGEKCTVHVVQGVEGNIGAGRALGYALGSHEFVSFVDCDDYVLPGVMDACLSALDRHRAVATLERRLWGDRFDSSLGQSHHLVVYRRSDIEPLIGMLGDHPLNSDELVMRKLNPVQIPFIGYVWRMHDKQVHRNCTIEARAKMEAACRQ